MAVIIGIIIGSAGTYYSNYAFNFVGMSEIALPHPSGKILEEEIYNTLPKNIITNELQYSLVEVKRTDFGINGEKPLEGGMFLIAKIEIENFGKNEVIVYGSSWMLKDEEGRTYTPKTFNAIPESDGSVFSIRIPPGFTVVKNIGFEIPSSLDIPRELYVADKAFESKPIFLAEI